MNKLICSWSFRESAVWVIPVILIALVYILAKPTPFRFFDGLETALGVALGFLLGFRIFWDGGGVRPFLFSRAFSPTRFFLVRWSFGLGVLLATWGIIAVLFAAGIRELVQTAAFQNGWFPMIRYLELRSLLSAVPISICVYQTTVFFVVWYRFLGNRRYQGFEKIRRFVMTILAALCLIQALFFIGALFFATAIVSLPVTPECPDLFLIFGIPALFQTLIMPFCGQYCYCTQEIES
jgi:hypothetical protein